MESLTSPDLLHVKSERLQISAKQTRERSKNYIENVASSFERFAAGLFAGTQNKYVGGCCGAGARSLSNDVTTYVHVHASNIFLVVRQPVER